MDAVEALPPSPEASDHGSDQVNCSDKNTDSEVPWLKFVFFFFPGGFEASSQLEKFCSFHA